jgi:hypothetical protein
MDVTYSHEDSQSTTPRHRVRVHVGIDTDKRISWGVQTTFVGPHTHPPTTEIGLDAPMPTNNLSTHRVAKLFAKAQPSVKAVNSTWMRSIIRTVGQLSRMKPYKS